MNDNNITETVRLADENGVNTIDTNVEEQTTYETGEKMFTQTQLKELITERLKRERKVNEALVPVKDMLNTLADKGVIPKGSYSSMAKALTDALNHSKEKAEKQAENAQEEPNLSCGKDQSLAGADAKPESLQTCENGENEQVENKAQSQNETDFFSVIGMIREKYPEDDLGTLLNGGLFESFAKGRNGSICDIYGDYRNFLKCLNGTQRNNEAEKTQDGEDYGNTQEYSTAFSRYSGTGYDCGLTKQQMEIAKEAGLSYREYEELLNSVPKTTRRVNY